MKSQFSMTIWGRVTYYLNGSLVLSLLVHFGALRHPVAEKP